jgi:hypothetical protein
MRRVYTRETAEVIPPDAIPVLNMAEAIIGYDLPERERDA